VVSISLLPPPVDAATGQIDAGISFELGKAYVGGTAPTGDVSSWEGAIRREDIRSHDRGRWGIGRFDVQAQQPDPERPLAVLPPDIVGLLRWRCVEPTGP
jgi:hypothetical protein